MIFFLESWHNAGTEQYVYLLAKELNEKNINVHLVIFGSVDELHLKLCEPVFSKITVLTDYGFSKYKALYEILNESDARSVHFHLYSNLLPTLCLSKLLGKKTIATYHIPLSNWSIRHRIFWIMASFLSNTNIAVASTIKNEFLKYRSPNVKVINPPVSMNGERVSCGSVFNIVGVGRLSNMQKDWPTLIRAISILKNDYNHQIKVTICGGGPDYNTISQLISSLRLNDECVLTGHVDKESIEDHLIRADLFVLPSIFEGFGIAPVEAMQVGLPTVTANYPASSDYIIDGVTGWTFPIGDEERLARLLNMLIIDEKTRDKVVLVGQEVALDKFSPRKIARMHIDEYNSLMSKD
ncbi:glycosyltransferase family 4 protein [Vibrio sp. F13]|uniref:glycosyltransferase family 4 protein n=1 Tax=Vibrio sp. F13 TaxID=2070777 RepID=UPI0010BD701C|nr:glycosyltransferase family 4 protein [Vibrio sp. F13]TKF99451.1 glycosyltransferase family 4 protein [Vibrio sp. F13]